MPKRFRKQSAFLLLAGSVVLCFSFSLMFGWSRSGIPATGAHSGTWLDLGFSEAEPPTGVRAAKAGLARDVAGAKEEAARQLPYAEAADEELGLPPDLGASSSRMLPETIPGRRIPEVVPFADLASCELANRVVPLPEANTLAHLSYQTRRLGRLLGAAGQPVWFNPQTLLVKLRGHSQASALRVEPMREWAAVQVLRRRRDVEFAELDVFERRQFSPNDSLLPNQWHHAVLGSEQAWDNGFGGPTVRVAIVDTPFQMDHPDLAANVVPGWDVVANIPVNSSTGIVHSTMCAGMAAAVINNGLGVAGAANCAVLPLNINGAVSEMYNAIIWAADHNVRVVNISWSGADSDILEAAAYYLRTNANGILAMAAIDGTGYLAYTNQPDIYCISMTDAADNFQQTRYGGYIDFAAPGYQVYSTTTGGGYAYGSGTSYATPLFCGVVAWLMNRNPTLGPGEVIGILANTARDLGPAGPDEFYGWGRIDFGAAAQAATATLPRIANLQVTNGVASVSANFQPGLNYALWRTPQLLPAAWTLVTNAVLLTNVNLISLADPAAPANRAFYRIQATAP